MASMVGLFVGAGLLLSIISVPMILGKIKPSGLYGLRVKKTLENPDIWYAVNCYSGKWLFGTGLVIVAAAIGIAWLPGLSKERWSRNDN